MIDGPVLGRGDRGEWVEYLAQLLAERGYHANGTPGEFDEELERALMAYQQDASLPVDGRAGPRTWLALGLHADTDGPVVDAVWPQDFPELYALADAGDMETWARTIAGVDPDRYGVDERTRYEWLNIRDAGLVAQLRVFAGPGPAPLAEMYGALDWVSWAQTAFRDLGERLTDIGLDEDAERFRARAAGLQGEYQRVRDYA